MQILPSIYGSLAQINTNDPLAVGLVAWWPMQDGGNIAVDAGGNGLIGSGTGTPTRSAAPLGRAWKFDGSTQFVSFGTSTLLCPPACTVSCWINPTSLANAYSSLVNRVNSIGTIFDQLFVKSNGKLAVYLSASAVVSYDGSGSATLSTGTWYHVAWTYSSATGLVGYVNAAVDATAAANGPITSFAATLYAAEDSFTAGRRFNGQMADIRLYNRALTPSEISDLYRYQRRPLRRKLSTLSNKPASTYRPRIIRWAA